MARGWESKSVEEQQEEARRRVVDHQPARTPEETKRAQDLASLELARARVLSDLQHACRPAHRGMLEQALADVDARIAALKER